MRRYSLISPCCGWLCLTRVLKLVIGLPKQEAAHCMDDARLLDMDCNSLGEHERVCLLSSVKLTSRLATLWPLLRWQVRRLINLSGTHALINLRRHSRTAWSSSPDRSWVLVLDILSQHQIDTWCIFLLVCQVANHKWFPFHAQKLMSRKPPLLTSSRWLLLVSHKMPLWLPNLTSLVAPPSSTIFKRLKARMESGLSSYANVNWLHSMRCSDTCHHNWYSLLVSDMLMCLDLLKDKNRAQKQEASTETSRALWVNEFPLFVSILSL